MKNQLLLAVVLFPVPVQAAQSAAIEPAAAGARVLDLDGDGALDLLVVQADGTLRVRRNVGARSFLDVPQELPRVLVTSVLCTDLDADGIPDLYLVSPGADVALRGEGGGLFREATAELGLTESGPGLAAERLDVDGDGLSDLVVHEQSADVLFWARPDGRFERDASTSDGAASSVVQAEVRVSLHTEVTPGTSNDPGETESGPALGVAAGAPSAGGAALSSAPSTPSTVPAIGMGFDARYVNDDMGEVGSADIVDGSLTGADVSTSGGNVTFGGTARLTAQKAIFGKATTASGLYSAVLGGQGNSAAGLRSVVSGGLLNTSTAIDTTVSGGNRNHATSNWATVGGGRYNVASGVYATVSGGMSNTASSFKAMVPGGYRCSAAGSYSFAAGRRAKANHNGSFVWGDSANVDKLSSAVDEFDVYAEGGARIFAVGQATPSLVVDSAGRVGIGTATPGFALEVNGLAHRLDDASTWTVTSDARLKRNVRGITGALETLLALRGVTFEYTDPARPGLRRGFVAQEVEEVLPEWVEEGADGFKRLTLSGFEALAVEALREQQREIEAQARELAALRAEIERLDARLAGAGATDSRSAGAR